MQNLFYFLFYYDNRNNSGIDFLIDDYVSLTSAAIEVKSGKDYHIYSALNRFLRNENYNVKKPIVLSNERDIIKEEKIVYMPIYFSMFL